MNASRMPWWAWAIILFFVLQIFSRNNISLFPLLIVAFVVWTALGSNRRSRGGPVGPAPGEGQLPAPDQPPGHGMPQDGPAWGPPSQQGWPPPQSEPGMPRIDVPGYPDQPATGTGSGIPDGPPPLPGTPESSAWTAPSTADPAVTLAQMEVAQLGRDLDAASRGGEDQRVDQVLTRLGAALDRLSGTLEVSGQRDRGSRAFRARVDAVRADVAKALREKPGSPQRAAQVARISTAFRT